MAEDLAAKWAKCARLEAAKIAAADLRQLSRSCRTACLRDEGAIFVAEALDVITAIEDMTDMTSAYSCKLLDENIGRAALKAEIILKVLAGRIAAADRQAKPSSIGLIGRQLSDPHKQMFKDARESLKQVIPGMTGAADTDLADTDSTDAAQQQQHLKLREQVLQALQDTGSSSELSVDYRGNKVTTVALIPGPGAPSNIKSSTLWVGLHEKVELFVGGSSSNKREVLTEKGQDVTCVVSDIAGGVWTGHADGVVQLHDPRTWYAAQHPSSVGVPVRSMAVDQRGFCWVGDEAGIIRVLMLDPQSGQLGLKVQLAPPQAQGLLNLALHHDTTAAAWTFSQSSSSYGSSSFASITAPIKALCSRGLAVFSSGGRSPYDITVWHSQEFAELEVSTYESFGSTCSFAVLPWVMPHKAPEAGCAIIGASSSSFAAQGDSSAAVASVPAIGMAVEQAAVQSRDTGPAGQVAQPSAEPLAPGAAGTAVDTNDYSSWRLLTGHECGQVLLWHFIGVTRSVATPQLLQLLCVIGEPQPQYAVRGMAVFDDLAMLISVHANGELVTRPMPKYDNVPSSGGRSGGGFAAASVAHWEPGAACIKAHESPIVATSCLGELLVTATSTTVRLWTAERLKLEAQGDAVIFSGKDKADNTGSTAAAIEAAIAEAMSGASLNLAAPVSSSTVTAGLMVGTGPQQQQQSLVYGAQHQQASSLQADSMPAWQQTGLIAQHQGLMGCNPAALSTFQQQTLRQAGHAGMPGQWFTEQYPGPVPAAGNWGPSRGSLGTPGYSRPIAASQDSLQPLVGAGSSVAAAEDGPGAADGRTSKYYKPLDDDLLNKPLRMFVPSIEDVPEQARKALEAWEMLDNTLKHRQESRSTGDVSKTQQQQQQKQQRQQVGASDLAHKINAALGQHTVMSQPEESSAELISYTAIKQLHLGLPGSKAVVARCSSDGRQVLQLQLRLQQRLQPAKQAQLLKDMQGAVKQRHPHVLQPEHVRISDQCLSCVIEPCSVSLMQYVQQREGRLSEGLARWMFQQLVLGLDYCHRQDIAGIPLQHSLLQVVANLPQPIVKLIPVPSWVLSRQSSKVSTCNPPLYKAPSETMVQERIADDLLQCGLLLVAMLGGTAARAPSPPEQHGVQYSVPAVVSRSCQHFLADLLQQPGRALPTAASILWHPWVKQHLPRRALEVHETCLIQAQRLQGQPAAAAAANSNATAALQQMQQDMLLLQQQLKNCARAVQQVPQPWLLHPTVQHSLYKAVGVCTSVLQALSILQGDASAAGRVVTQGLLVTQLASLHEALNTLIDKVNDLLQQLQLQQQQTQHWCQQQQQQQRRDLNAAARQLLALLLSSWGVVMAAQQVAQAAHCCKATANNVVVGSLYQAVPYLPHPCVPVQKQQSMSAALKQLQVLFPLLYIAAAHTCPWQRSMAAFGLLAMLLILPGDAGTEADAHTGPNTAMYQQLQQLPAELLISSQQHMTADILSTASYIAQQGANKLLVVGLPVQPAVVDAPFTSSWQHSKEQQQELQQGASKHPLLVLAQQQQQSCSLQQYQPLLELLQRLPLSSTTNEQQSHGTAAAVFSTVMGLCCSPPLLLMQQPPGGALESWLLRQQQLLQGAASGSSTAATMQWARAAPWSLLLQLLREAADALCIMHEQAAPAAHGHMHAGAVLLLQPLPDLDLSAGPQQQGYQQQALPEQRLSQLSLVGPWQQVASQARMFRPCITAGEVLLTAAPVSPATDVYGFGILMLQLAACWVPKQHSPGSDQQLAEMRWCHKMLQSTGSTFPSHYKAAAAAAEVADLSWGLDLSDVMQLLPQLPPADSLPSGYVQLMHDCCCVDATKRPTTKGLLQRLDTFTV